MSQVALKAGTRPPWVGLAAATWVQFATGNTFTFPIFTPTLKTVLGFSQQQITMLGVAVDIGENFGILPGIACNKFSPWIVLAIGASACFSGYGVIWLAVSQTLKNLPFFLLWIALLIGSNSAAFFSTVCIVTNMKNFPLNRGTVSGLMKGYSGLGAAIYPLVYSLVLHKSVSALLLFITFGLPLICFSMMYLIRNCSPATSTEGSSQNFMFLQVASVVLGVYLLVTKYVDTTFTLGYALSYALIGITIVLMMAPLAIPLRMTLCPSIKKSVSDPLFRSISDPLLPIKEVDSEREESDMETLLAEGEGAVGKRRRPRRGEDFMFHETLVKADFWLLWLAYFLGSGAGVTVLNNLSQIANAKGSHVDPTLLLSLFSFCNFAGRLGGGAISEYYARNKLIPRATWMVITQGIMVISFLLFTSALDITLYIATALIGICYGAQFTTMIPTASELFGLKHFGVIYNFILLGNPVGAFLFSSILASNVYDSEAAKQGVSTCTGPACFDLTFRVMTGVCAIGALVALILTIRVRPVYQMLYSGGSFSHQTSSVH